MKKMKYLVYSDGTKPSRKPFTYNFGNTKNIKMTVTKEGFFIEALRTIKKDHKAILNDPLFTDAIKKACLIKIIKYGEIKYKSIVANIDGETKKIAGSSEEKNPIVFGLCGSGLERNFASIWNGNQFEMILNTTKSKEGRLHASLYSLIMAKSKKFESEKFVYLWMAMNGLYGYAAEIAKPSLEGKNKQGWIKKEIAQIKFFSMLCDIKFSGRSNNDKETKDTLLLEIEKTMTPQYCCNIDPVLQNGEMNNALLKTIKDVLKRCGQEECMSAEGTLLFYVPYKIRCKYFHSERSMPLFCLKNEHPLPMISILNTILENFIEKNLSVWMESTERKRLERKVDKLAKACKCNKKGYLDSCVVNGKELK